MPLRKRGQLTRASDLYSRNVLFAASDFATLSETQVVDRLGSPRIGSVEKTDKSSHDSTIPPYLVAPIALPKSCTKVKIIDFGNGKTRLHVVFAQ